MAAWRFARLLPHFAAVVYLGGYGPTSAARHPHPVLRRPDGAAAGNDSPTYYGPPRGDACSGLWPLPHTAACSGMGMLAMTAREFSFVAGTDAARASARLARAFTRYHAHLFAPLRPHRQLHLMHLQDDAEGLEAATGYRLADVGQVTRLVVEVASSNESLALGVDEGYSLHVIGGGAPASESTAVLRAATVYGALRGLETFSQLTIRTVGHADVVLINSTSVVIEDAPRFPWRGIAIAPM